MKKAIRNRLRRLTESISDPDVKAVSSRTGRPYKSALLDMRAARERYGISFRDYNSFECEKCGTEDSLAEKKKQIDEQKSMAARIEKGKENPHVKIVASRTGLPLEEVLSNMVKAQDEYGISFMQYANNDGEKCSTEEDFKKLKAKAEKKSKKKNKQIIKNLCRVTEWTEEEAEKNIEHVRETFGMSAQKYYNLGYYMLDDDGIREELASVKERKEELKDKVAEESGWDRKKIDSHMRYVSAKYGIDATDYMIIRAWRLSDEELDGLARVSAVKTITRKYNNMKAIGKLTDKLKFDRAYSDCLGRKFWANDEDADFESFCAFWDGMDEAMYKPLNLSKARGVEKIKRPEDLKKAYDELKAGPHVLLEEVVKQHPDIAAIYPHSVNTVRMVTLLEDDEFRVVCAFMRFGKGGTVVDNMFAGGMIAGVDEINGIVDTGAVDRDGDVHDCHPDTGTQIKGFKIPNYDKVLEITEKALRKDPDINFVGWDVAVTEEGAVIIEGNSRPDAMAYQLPYMVPPLNEPKLYKYEPYL